jgi:hypothetical protein
MNSAVYDRAGYDLAAPGLCLDLRACGYHVFNVTVPA